MVEIAVPGTDQPTEPPADHGAGDHPASSHAAYQLAPCADNNAEIVAETR